MSNGTPSPPPIALTTLSIRDFRGIEKLDLNFRGPDGLPNHLVVLAGPNGSGKTAVLEAALIAIGGHKLAVGPRGKPAIRKGAANYSITADCLWNDEQFTCKDEATFLYPHSPEAVPFWYFSSWRDPKLVGPIGVTVGRAGRRPNKNDQNRLLNVKQLLVNASAIEKYEPGQKLFEADYTKWIGEINAVWNRFNPRGGKFGVTLAESGSLMEGFDVVLHLIDGSRLEVDRLSAGQIELFLFLSALVLNDDSEGIVFIDEPELHLDPQWHALVIRSLMRLQPRAQFIVATHSPEIYDAAMSYERHFLVSKDDPRAKIWDRVHAGV